MIFFQRIQTAISDMKLAQILQSVFFFFLVFTNLIPGLFATPCCRLENQDLHVNRTRKSTFWVSRGSRCENRCRAPPIRTSVRDVRNCGLKQNPNQTSQLVSSFCVTWRSSPIRSFANMLSHALSLEQEKCMIMIIIRRRKSVDASE